VGLAAIAGLAFAPASAQAADPAATPTFAKDIAPIFQEKCEVCHRPDSIAPMSLVTYQEARPWARSIKSRVAARQMPPWHIDKTVGIQAYKNDRSLSDEQIDTIVRWVDGGAPMGNAADMPAARVWPTDQGWSYAPLFGQTEPDLIIRSTPYTQKAGAQDAWWTPVVETGLTEMRWVRAIEVRPSSVKGRKITHHVIGTLVQDENLAPEHLRVFDDPAADPSDVTQDAGLFMEWAVGKQGELMRPGSGRLMLPGSRIRFNIHYSNGGEDITDAVELGIYFYPKGQEPKFRQVLRAYNAGGIDIMPNETKVISRLHILPRAGRVETFQPHLHLRGKAMMMEAIYPNGRTEVLSYVNNFSFNWHVSYVYDDDAAPLLPKGTILRVTAWHDNTSANPANPDPTQWVGSGDRTVDEMAHAWVNITFMSDKDFEAEVEARKARQSRSTQQQ
jgi:hypothetical protein